MREIVHICIILPLIWRLVIETRMPFTSAQWETSAHTHIFSNVFGFVFITLIFSKSFFVHVLFFHLSFCFWLRPFFRLFSLYTLFFFFVIFLHYGQRCNKHTVKRMSSIYSRDCQLYAAMNTNRQVSPTYVCCTVISAVVHVVESHQTPSLLRLLSSPLLMCTILCPVPRQI